MTIVYTSAGFELIISGQSVQKVAVHVEMGDVSSIVQLLKTTKQIKNFAFKEKDRKPGG